MSDSDGDLLALQEHAILLDIVAARGDLSSFADDPFAALLGAFIAELDEGLDAMPRMASLITLPAPQEELARKRRGRSAVMVAAGTTFALVASSGLAAAVTGDPFMPFKEAVSAVSGNDQNPDVTATAQVKPVPAATQAQVSLAMSGISRAIAAGDMAQAQLLLDRAVALADEVEDVPPGLLIRLEKLQERIDRPAHGNSGHVDPAGTKNDKNQSEHNGGNPGKAHENQSSQQIGKLGHGDGKQGQDHAQSKQGGDKSGSDEKDRGTKPAPNQQDQEDTSEPTDSTDHDSPGKQHGRDEHQKADPGNKKSDDGAQQTQRDDEAEASDAGPGSKLEK